MKSHGCCGLCHSNNQCWENIIVCNTSNECAHAYPSLAIRTEYFERTLSSPRQIALERLRHFESNGHETVVVGLAELMIRLLDDAANAWILSLSSIRQCWHCRSHRRVDVDVGANQTLEEEEKKADGVDDASVVGTDRLALKVSSPLSLPSCPRMNEMQSCPPLFARSDETHLLRRILSLHLFVSRLDPTLAEELGRGGSHLVLSRLLRFDLSDLNARCECECEGACACAYTEEDEDAAMELQDLACEIGSLSGGSFPMRLAPLGVEELSRRLPLPFRVQPLPLWAHTEIASIGGAGGGGQGEGGGELLDAELYSLDHTVLVNQVTARQSAQEDVGFVMWPSAVILSSWVVSNAALLRDKSVLELGAGCGLVGLTAAGVLKLFHDKEEEEEKEREMTDACSKGNEEKCCRRRCHRQPLSKVILTDYNQTVLQNLKRNIRLNDVADFAQTCKLDFSDQSGGGGDDDGWLDGSGERHDAVDIVLAADVICRPDDAIAVADTIHACLKSGGQAFVVSADARHRFGVDRFESECFRLGMDVVVINDVERLYHEQQLFHWRKSLEQTSGFVEGMVLTMFHVSKGLAKI